jgi:hypothetical protein
MLLIERLALGVHSEGKLERERINEEQACPTT